MCRSRWRQDHYIVHDFLEAFASESWHRGFRQRALPMCRFPSVCDETKHCLAHFRLLKRRVRRDSKLKTNATTKHSVWFAISQGTLVLSLFPTEIFSKGFGWVALSFRSRTFHLLKYAFFRFERLARREAVEHMARFEFRKRHRGKIGASAAISTKLFHSELDRWKSPNRFSCCCNSWLHQSCDDAYPSFEIERALAAAPPSKTPEARLHIVGDSTSVCCAYALIL